MRNPLNASIKSLGLSARCSKLLESRPDLVTIGDLARLSAEELLRWKDFGLVQIKEIEDKLARLGLRLGLSEEEQSGFQPGLPPAEPKPRMLAWRHCREEGKRVAFLCGLSELLDELIFGKARERIEITLDPDAGVVSVTEKEGRRSVATHTYWSNDPEPGWSSSSLPTDRLAKTSVPTGSARRKQRRRSGK